MRLGATIAILCLRAAAQPASCTIGGAVTDRVTNKPIERARVIVEGGTYGLTRLTNDLGNFCFQTLTPGEYHLRVEKPGYLELSHPHALAVDSDSPPKPLSIRLIRYGGLSGTVLDADGELLSGVTVTVWQRTRSGPDQVSAATTDAQGRFHVSRLAAGTYYLSAKSDDRFLQSLATPVADSRGQMPREQEVETFYSSSFTFAGATPLEVRPGQQLDNLVLGLKKARLRRVTGRIADLARGSLLTYSSDTETRSGNIGVVPVASDGTFVKAGLPPGKYSFWIGDGQKTIARKDVDLTAGDALGITLDPIETMDVPVTFRMEGSDPGFRPPAQWGSILLMRDGSNEAVGLDSPRDGTYQFTALARGVYALRIMLGEQEFYLKRVTYGGELQTGDKIDLRAGRTGGLEITLSPNFAEVQGEVTLADREVDDLTVIVVDGGHIVQETSIDQKGRFHVNSIAPGKYRVFAIEGLDADDWDTPELAKILAAKSVELDLKENDKKQVSVPAISAGEWAAALKKLGG